MDLGRTVFAPQSRKKSITDFTHGNTIWIPNPFPQLYNREAGKLRRASTAVTIDLPCDRDSGYRTGFHPPLVSHRPKWVPAIVTEIDLPAGKLVVTTTKVREKRVVLQAGDLEQVLSPRKNNLVYRIC